MRQTVVSRTLLLSLVLLSGSLAARAGDKQRDAEQLLEKAISQSDIRASAAASFRLATTARDPDNGTADFAFITEAWVSRDQWRRETKIGAFRRVEVGEATRRWVLDNSDNVALKASIIQNAIDPRAVLATFLQEHLKLKLLKDRTIDGQSARCLKADNRFTVEIYCVNAGDGMLMSYESTFHSKRGSPDTYSYSDYQKFGDHWFPRLVRYRSAENGSLEFQITLAPLTSPDPSAFSPPAGAIAFGNCSATELTPPRAELTQDPVFPSGARSASGLAVLSLIVSSSGVPERVRVERSTDAAFAQLSVRAVEAWRFKPASCRDTPVAAEINVETEFRQW